MAVDVEELIISPFWEVVARGKEAVANAEACEDELVETSKAMSKAAKDVVREGERAVKRLQPLWDSQVEKHGKTFKDSMARNEEIEEKRRKLEDLLYDFEDYVEIDNFKEEKYSELQAVTRSLALDVLDIIKRLKIDGIPVSPPPTQSSFPPLPPLPANFTLGSSPPPGAGLKSAMKARSSQESQPAIPPKSAKRFSAGSAKKGNLEMRKTMSAGLTRSDTTVSRASNRTSMDSLPPHTPNSGMMPPPLDFNRLLESRLGHADPAQPNESARTISTRVAQSDHRPFPPNHLRTTGTSARSVAEPASPASSRRPEKTEGSISNVGTPSSPLPRTTAWVSDQGETPGSPRMTVRQPPMALTIETPTIPENEALTTVTSTNNQTSSQIPALALKSPDTNFKSEHLGPSLLSKFNRLSMEAPLNESPIDASGGTVGSLFSHSSRRTSVVSSQSNNTTSTAPSFAVAMPNGGRGLPASGAETMMSLSPLSSVLDGPLRSPSNASSNKRASYPSFAALTHNGTGLSPLNLPSAADFDDGLMLADEWATVVSEGAVSSIYSAYSGGRGIREADCTIGPKSSLYQMKGFCEGAQAYKDGGHWQGIHKATGYVTGQTSKIGRCNGCGYAHHYDEVSLDTARDPKANFSNSGIRFRIRFLYKSHLVTNKMAEAYYACLFCAQAGQTIREGDATVFRSSDSLFRHLARHPQPLPEVPGLTVLYGTEFETEDTRPNDFDVHFVNPVAPGASGMPDSVIPELARLPVATAIKPHVQRYGEKKLARPDGVGEKELLQFFIGARLVGVEFPVRWGGKWATAWHDGKWGPFPAKSIELEKPRRHEVPPMHQTMGGSGSKLPVPGGPQSTLSVVARWKFEPKDAADKGWLVFDKGDTIRNVGYLYKDHWCWSGTNPKGKVGVFPRSFVMYDDVKEEALALRPVKSVPAKSVSAKSVSKKLSERSKSLFSRSKLINDSTSSVIEIYQPKEPKRLSWGRRSHEAKDGKDGSNFWL